MEKTGNTKYDIAASATAATDIAVAILFGGKSGRMGSPKENVVIPGDGRTFLERMCDEANIALPALNRRTVIRSDDTGTTPDNTTKQRLYLSIRAGQEINIPGADEARQDTGGMFRDGFTIVTDRYAGIGPLGGIASVLERARADGYDAVLMLACDMYRYDHTEMQAICGQYRGEDILFARTAGAEPFVSASGSGTFPGADGSGKYDLQPLASIYSVSVLDAVKAQIASGDYRIRDLAEHVSNVGYYDTRHPEFYENRNVPF